MKRKSLLYITCILLPIQFIMCSCGNYSPASISNENDIQENPLENSNLSGSLQMVTSAEMVSIAGCTTQDGFYEAIKDQDGVRFYFTDYKNKVKTILCSNPSCTHDDSSCTGFLPNEVAEYAGIFPFQDKLIINYSAPHYGVPSTLCQINLDGTDRNILYTFSSTEIARDPVITDGDNLFFVLDDVNPETAEFISYLVEFDVAECKVSPIFQCTANDFLVGCSADKFAFKSIDSSGNHQLFFVDTNGKKTDSEISWMGYMPSYSTGSSLYIFDSENSALTTCKYDTLDYKTIKIQDTAQIVHDIANSMIDYVCDDKLFLVIYHEKNSEEVGIDVNTGQIYPVILHGVNAYGEKTRPMYIITEFGDSYYVETGTITADLSKRALIKKSDFWNGIENFDFINSLS